MEIKFRPVGFKPEKFYRVGEIVQILREQGIKISRQTVHNYTLVGLIEPAKRTQAGHRLYPEDVFDKLLKVERLKAHHTLAEVKKIMRQMK